MPAGLDELLRHIGANVYRLRVRRGLTQAELAERADLDVRFVQRIERAATAPSLKTLLAIAGALQTPPAALLRPAHLPHAKVGRPRKQRRPSR